MNKTVPGFLLCALAPVVLLAGCSGGDSNDQPTVTAQDLAAGSYTVSVGSMDAPTLGKYYAGADGGRLLLLQSADGMANKAYRRSGSTASWVAVPAAGSDISVTLLRSDKESAPALTAAAMAGSYVAQVASGVTARFTVDAAGTLSAGATTCKLSGKLTDGVLPNTVRLNLTATGCGSTVPANSEGVAIVDTDEAPAKFRMVTDDSKLIADIRAYVE